MRQILQNLRTGLTSLEEIPAPGLARNGVLIQTRASLISAGTERMLVEFGKASLLAKARSQPEKVRQVLDKIKTDGLQPTLETVFKRLDEPLPLGYCNAGVVIDVGPAVTGLRVGDRVVSNGCHAEIVCVPEMLCAKIPDAVGDEQAAFTVLSSIGLQGIRLMQPTLGESFVVYGMGLIGLICVQLLAAHGCRVLGVDINPKRLKLAEQFGAHTVLAGGSGDPVAAAAAWTEGAGVDGVLITASAKTDDIVHQSAQMCRKRGRIVLVGVVGLNLRRSDFYEKELTFQVSCSYGPGRYDDKYEQAGHDYPPAFVRWSERRNFEAVLNALVTKRFVVDDLITNRFSIDNGPQAYDMISKDPGVLGVILEYPDRVERTSVFEIVSTPVTASGMPVLGVVGAGNFSKMTLMPALAKTDAVIECISDLDGAMAKHLAVKYNVARITTNYKELFENPKINGVLLPLTHNLHASFVMEALRAGKHVFVEKPLAMNAAEVRDIVKVAREHPGQIIMVGFNRRFSPHTQKAKALLAGRSEPLCMNMLVNAGYIPPESWVHNMNLGGGRIIGEACHFMDLMVFLTGSKITTVSSAMVGGGVATREDKMSIVLRFEDGSIGSVNYFSNGAKSYPKELLQVFSNNRVLEIDNFRRTVGYGFSGFKRFKTSRQDKGHTAEFDAFVESIRAGGQPPIPFAEFVNVTLASFAAMKSASENVVVDIVREYGMVTNISSNDA